MTDPLAAFDPTQPVEIYANGACSGNPGPAGSGWVILQGGRVVAEGNRGLGHGTNNIAEITAAFLALDALPPRCAVSLKTDSKYVIDGMTKWIHGWRRRNWTTADGKPVKNKELWLKLIAAIARHATVTFVHVRGHAGNRWNTRADELAVAARQ